MAGSDRATAAAMRPAQGNLDGGDPSPPAEGSYEEPRPAQGNHDGMKQTRSNTIASATGDSDGASGNGKAAPDPNDTEVLFDVYIIEVCSLDELRVYFPYDSAKLQGAGGKLAQLADCIASGPLKAQNLKLTGHADPRGSESYNKELGKSRAETVADVLVSRGVARDRIALSSKGEKEASSQKSDWPHDRRVEVSVQRAPSDVE
jgi:outer membrane protein OmpA-like peptidoglycan-associated protein